MTPPIADRKLCESATRDRAYLLTQLRAGHNWFFKYSKAPQFLEDDHHWVCSAQGIIIMSWWTVQKRGNYGRSQGRMSGTPLTARLACWDAQENVIGKLDSGGGRSGLCRGATTSVTSWDESIDLNILSLSLRQNLKNTLI
jgi:hypothetical protein